MHVQNILKVKGTMVATIGPDDSLADATASLRDHGVGALVVSRDGRTIDGIMSERDVVRALRRAELAPMTPEPRGERPPAASRPARADDDRA